MATLFSSPLKHKLIGLTAYLALLFTCIAAFVGLADEVIEQETLWVDEALLTTINDHSAPFWDASFVVITSLGGVGGVIVISAGTIALLLLRQRRLSALTVGVSVAGAALLNLGLKAVFERTRPDLWEHLITETSFSFPSGHAMGSAALGLAIIIICWNTRYRWYVVVIAGIYIFLVGFSRLYLGVHYPTDIVAGWLMSGAWVSVVAAVLYAASPKRERRRIH